MGLEKKGESHNVGTEQAHLNNVENADLQITGLGVVDKTGVGVEFLQYIQPGAGIEYPKDTQCDDLWNWIIKAEADDIESLFIKLKNSNAIFISKHVVTINGIKQFIARDTDGHAIWFIQK